jgi:hypothetical protein
MPVNDGEYVEGRVEFELADGTIAQNVFHFVADFLSEESNSAVTNAVIGYIEDIYGAIATYLSDGFTVNLSKVSKITWDSDVQKWVTELLLGTGLPTITHTNTDDPFPNQIAPVLVANTNRPKTRGRKFLMGCVETMAQGGDLVTAAVTAMTNALNHYIADETVSGSNNLDPGVLREGVEEFRHFTNGEVNSIVGTQRRRKPGVGG